MRLVIFIYYDDEIIGELEGQVPQVGDIVNDGYKVIGRLWFVANPIAKVSECHVIVKKFK